MQSIQQLMSLRGRVALITGGAGNLGYAMAESLAEARCSIILLDIDAKKTNKRAAALAKKYKLRCTAIIADLTNENAISFVPVEIMQKTKRLDILINCAALVGTSNLKGWAVPFAQQDLNTWRLALEVNLTSTFALVQACYPLLMRSKNGSIINIASIYGVLGPDMGLYAGTGMGNPAAYAASKGGLVQLTRWLATTLAPSVRVNSISIGGVFRNHKEPFLSRYVSKTPLQRMATNNDIKGAALFLASDLSQYVTGHNLMVDGGFSAW